MSARKQVLQKRRLWPVWLAVVALVVGSAGACDPEDPGPGPRNPQVASVSSILG